MKNLSMYKDRFEIILLINKGMNIEIKLNYSYVYLKNIFIRILKVIIKYYSNLLIVINAFHKTFTKIKKTLSRLDSTKFLRDLSFTNFTHLQSKVS